MRIDLHVHSTASDGALAPDAVVRAARAGGLDVLAITDHDTTAGLPAAEAAAREVGIRLVPGCELSSTHEGRDIHILGYDVDPGAPSLRAYERRARERRLSRMAEMVERLIALGCSVELDRVVEIAGGLGVVGRPHLARALVERGHARDVPDAFDRLIGDGLPAFVPTRLHVPVDAVVTVREAGGLAVWAHPPGDLLDALLPALVGAGLAGLEAYRPGNTANLTRRLLERARTAGLLVSGGSDWHDLQRSEPLGTFHVDEIRVGALLAALR